MAAEEILVVLKGAIDDLLGKLDVADAKIDDFKADVETGAELNVDGDEATALLEQIQGKIGSLRSRTADLSKEIDGLGSAPGLKELASSAGAATIAIGLLYQEAREFSGLLDDIREASPEAGDFIDDLEKSFTRVKGPISLARTTLADFQEAWDTLQDGLAGGLSVFEIIFSDIEDISFKVGDVVRQLREEAEREAELLDEAITVYEGVIERLREAGDLDDNLGRLREPLEDIAESAERVGRTLPPVLQEIVDGYEKQDNAAKKAKESAKDHADALERASRVAFKYKEDLESLTAALEGNREELERETELLRDAIAEVQQGGEISEETSRRIAEAVADLIEKWRDGFGEIPADLLEAADAFGAFEVAAERAGEKASKAIGELADNVEKARDAVKEAAADLAEVEAAAPGGGRSDEETRREVEAQERIVEALKQKNAEHGLTIDELRQLQVEQAKLNELQRESFGFGEDPGFGIFDSLESKEAAAAQLEREIEARDKLLEAQEAQAAAEAELARAVRETSAAQQRQAAAQDTVAEGASTLADIQEQLGQKVTEAQEGASTLADINEQLGTSVDDAADNTIKLGDSLIKVGEEATEAGAKLEESKEQFDGAKTTLDGVGDAASRIADGLEDSNDELEELPSNLEAIEEAGATFVEGLTEPIESASQLADELERGGAGGERVAGALEDTVAAGEELPDTLEEAGEAVEEFTDQQGELNEQLSQQLAATQSLRAENEAFNQQATTGLQEWISLLQQVPPLIEQIKDALQELNDLRSEG